MKKNLMILAGLMFLGMNVYAQQEEPKIKTDIKYVDNDTNKIDTKTTLKYGDNNKVTEGTVDKYKYSDGKVSVVEITRKSFSANGDVTRETFEKDVYNRTTGEIRQKEVTTNTLIAGRMKLTYQDSDDVTAGSREVLKYTYDEITGALTRTETYEYSFITINGNNVKALEGCTVTTDSETSYAYRYNNGLFAVEVGVKDQSRKLTESRTYYFNSDNSLGSVDINKGPKPDKIEQKKEAEFILSLMK